MDFTLGIYQSIGQIILAQVRLLALTSVLSGYQEFFSYLENPSDKAFVEAVDRMKISTRQYAKRQISWIRNKLIPAVNAANSLETVAPLYLLDATGEAPKAICSSPVHSPNDMQFLEIIG